MPRLSAWDCPVALCFTIRRSLLKFVRFDGWTKMCMRGPRDTILNVTSWPIEIWIHRKLYANFNILQDLWDHIKMGELYVCRAKSKCPEDLYDCGNSKAMTCGSCVDALTAVYRGWRRTKSSRQWICGRCAQNREMSRPNF